MNVINVSTTDLADNPVFDTVGTDGIDLIFGNDGDNLIDGKGGDDIIFGGSGDDVIIGGEGDDVILGGDGADILRGDMVEAGDAAITAWDAAATQFNADNPGENIVFDENKLSLQLSDSVDGDDLILVVTSWMTLSQVMGRTLSHQARLTLMAISRLTRMSLTLSTHKLVIPLNSSMMMSGCRLKIKWNFLLEITAKVSQYRTAIGYHWQDIKWWSTAYYGDLDAYTDFSPQTVT